MLIQRGGRPGTGEPLSVRDSAPGSRLPDPLLPDVGLIALVPDRWENCWQSRHYILTRLARYFHVLWCNPPARTGLSTASYRQRGTNHLADPDTPPGFVVRDPPSWIPQIRRPTGLGRLLIRECYRDARRQLTRRGCEQILLSIWRPSYADALDLVAHHVSCYHIDDEYTFSDVEQPTDEREASLIRRVNQVFVTSTALLDKKGGLNPHTLFVPNGVDYAAYTRPWPEPTDLQPIPRPRIGYVGVIKKQLDLQLVYALAQRHRPWSFVFVGPRTHPEYIGRWIQKLAGLPNVHFLGEKPVSALPAYTQHLDVCMLCYKVDDYTKFIYPLKLHESLASGHPSVGTPIRTLQEVSSVLALAGTVEEWSAALAAMLTPAAHADASSAARRGVARQHDWDSLVHRIAVALGERLGPSYRQRVQQGLPQSPPLPGEA